MKIAYMSDIHLEFQVRENFAHLRDPCYHDYLILPYGPCVKELKKQGVDVVVLAGDIGTFKQHMDYASELIDYMDCEVVSILGNHEWYGKKFEQATIDKRRPTNPRHHFLNREERVIGGVRFLGCTLWTDFAATGDPEYVKAMVAPQILADFRLIEGMTPQIMEVEHRKDRQWLADRLAEPFAGETLIVTHNSPHSSLRNVNYPMDDRGACFVSDCNDLIESTEYGAFNWVYGHDHWSQRKSIGTLAIMSAQYGYPNENSNWSGIGLIEL
jgi:DNA repair exonuclease SbcCD nuclease subunit